MAEPSLSESHTVKKSVGRPELPQDARAKNRVIRMPDDLWDYCRSRPEGAGAYLRRLVQKDKKRDK